LEDFRKKRVMLDWESLIDNWDGEKLMEKFGLG